MKKPTTLEEILTGKTNTDSIPDIIINPDIAFRDPPSKTIAKIRDMFDPVKFDEIEFEEEIADFNLSLLSKSAVTKIIEIIREDEKTRGSDRIDTNEDILNSAQTSFVINKEVESGLYKKKAEEALVGKSHIEVLEYMENVISDSKEYIKNAKKNLEDFSNQTKKYINENE